MKSLFENISETVSKKSAQEMVSDLFRMVSDKRILLASSLGFEDQVLTHMVCAVTDTPRIVTLDTGRLFEETYNAMEKTMERYGFRYEFIIPDTTELQQMLEKHGPNLFLKSVELRKLCCKVRKVNPLQRVLGSADIMISGLRREQSITRKDLAPVEWDQSNSIIKVNPLYNWSEPDVQAFIKDHDIPCNELQYRGCRSIGCEPCTRAIGPEDDIRSGRWWWEEPEHKECGLHSRPL